MVVDTNNEVNSPINSEMESRFLNDNIKKPTSILYEGREESELIDGMRDDNYVAVVNRIDVIDKMLQDHNNGDTQATWYDAVDISSVSLQHCYLMEGISSTDIFQEEDFDPSIETCSVDDETIQISNVSINNVDTTRFYDDPRAQMDGGAKCSVTNILEILRNVTWFDNKKNRAPVHMKGSTSGTLIVPAAKEFSGQVMTKYFDLDNKKVNADLRKRGCVDLNNSNGYHLDYGNCTLTCVHSKRRTSNIEISGIIRGGLCYTQPIILPDLPKSHPHASILNSSRLAYLSDENFREDVDALTLKYIYQHQQKQHENLMEVLTQVPETFHTLPFHMLGTEQVLIDSLSDEARSHLWHQRLIHCGKHSMKDAHKHIEGVPNMSKFSFNDLTRCATCIKSKLTKNDPGHRSLRDTLPTPY